MRPAPGRRRKALPALLLLLALPAPAAEPQAPLEFIHIDANVGSSSGGHLALKTGDQVYHYQNDSGYLRLVREDWEHFRYVYNDIDNRNLHIARLRVPAAAAEQVRDRLGLMFMVQNRHVEFLEALERDAALLRDLAEGRLYEMRGIGFFERRPHESPALHELAGEIARRHGEGFAATERARLAGELASLAYSAPQRLDPAPELDRYPSYPASFAEQAEDCYSRWFALTAIAEEWPLRDGLLVEAGGAPLSAIERRWLESYREKLARAAIAGLTAGHPGGGYSLLLALARYTAVSESLATGRLLLLDALPSGRRAERFTQTDGQRGAVALLLARASASLPGVRRAVFALTEPDEAAYAQLEARASEIRELRHGLETQRPIRYSRQHPPPEGWGTALLPVTAHPPAAREQAKLTAEKRAENFRSRIEALYRYDLIFRNCVTELVGAVDSSFPSEPAITSALGGHLEPGERQSFIPFRFFELAPRTYRIESITHLPSYRNRMLRRLETHGGWTVDAAEASTLTSSVYDPQPGDSLFLLFTENVSWPRPLFGAINLAYGLGGSAVGVFTAPYDGGRRLAEGLRGAVFSLPELAFGNIRKGSFDGIRSRTSAGADGTD